MIPAHVFPDNSLNQSLFGILDITDKGYDVTFNGAGVAIQYQGAPIYFQEKLPTDLFWQLPLSPVLNRDQEAAHAQEEINVCIANSTTALQSDEDFVAFMHAAFGSPCPSTFLCALLRNWLDTIPRLTSALCCNCVRTSGSNAPGFGFHQKQASHHHITIAGSHARPSRRLR